MNLKGSKLCSSFADSECIKEVFWVTWCDQNIYSWNQSLCNAARSRRERIFFFALIRYCKVWKFVKRLYVSSLYSYICETDLYYSVLQYLCAVTTGRMMVFLRVLQASSKCQRSGQLTVFWGQNDNSWKLSVTATIFVFVVTLLDDEFVYVVWVISVCTVLSSTRLLTVLSVIPYITDLFYF